MDKKKVKELIEDATCKLNYFDEEQDNYEGLRMDIVETLEQVVKELSKSDWISVEDRLPEYGENVVARTKGGYMNVSYRRKIPRDRISKEIMDDNGFILNFNLHSEKIAYWHKIDKLEE